MSPRLSPRLGTGMDVLLEASVLVLSPVMDVVESNSFAALYVGETPTSFASIHLVFPLFLAMSRRLSPRLRKGMYVVPEASVLVLSPDIYVVDSNILAASILSYPLLLL